MSKSIAQNPITIDHLNLLLDDGVLELRALKEDRSVYRFYTLRINANLLGEAWVSLQFGRIGFMGRKMDVFFSTTQDAIPFLFRTIHKRLHAKKRIGVNYQRSGPSV